MGFPKYFVLILAFCSVSSTFGVNDFTEGISQFERDFYLQCVRSKPGNVVVSPLSVANALGLLSQGSGGKTFDELRTALHLSNNKALIASQFLEHRENLEKNAGDVSLSIANRIYVQQGVSLAKNFQDVAVSKFKSGIESLNFAESIKSARTINEFVEEKTNGKIKEIIEPNSLSSATQSVLVNAIYFKGMWEKPFSRFSKKGDFYISETEKQSVDFMFNTGFYKYGYIKELDADVLEMLYGNSNLSFVIVLPRERMGLALLETKLRNFDLTKITENIYRHTVKLDVPKFKVEYEISLNEVLRNMGITEMFSSNADFDGILESGEKLSISEIVHKATIEVNEKGAEAAAATGIALQVSIQLREFHFTVDHPFMYFIQDTETKTIIFSGRIEKF